MKKTSIISMLLVLTLVMSLFAGCSSDNTQPSESTSPSESAAPSEAPSAAPEQSAAPSADAPPADAPPAEAPPADETPAGEQYAKVDYTLPLFEKTEEISLYWVLLGGMGGASMPTKEELLFTTRVEEALNVELTYVQNGEAVNNEKYNLMVASGDMTDIIWESNCGAMGASSVYPGGYDKAIDDDVYVRLNDYLADYAPNYYYYVMGNENIRKNVITDTGNFYSIAMIYDQPQGVREGMFVRADYLEDTGLDMPKTTDEWLDVFAAMKAGGVQFPAGISNSGDIRGGAFASAFGTGLASGYKVDNATGEIVYDGTSQELRDFLEFFKVLWDNGYVNPDFMYAAMFDDSLQTSGATGTMGGMDNDIYSYMNSYEIPLSAAPVPVTADSNGSPKLASYEYRYMQTSGMKNAVITTSCENIEVALKYLDWFYSDEGIRAANFGFIEGESYEIVDGQAQVLPIMGERNENNNSYQTMYALDEGPMYAYVYLMSPIRKPEVVAAKQTWLDYDLEACAYTSLPTVSLTVEESESVSSLSTDIATNVSTNIYAFMMGERPLNDDTWAQYCAEIEGMGVDKVTEVYEAAYARYLAR